ncbi:hypothetical protein [Bartonella sp. F02]|uniref:hypothetical protein n=1 Tax=Bartonella sp. F02 TaxID=2967262 RepID=UPI0022A9471D|nr:hypothetical protein [Bartonella sp. F02]MCZ2328857.1 hypothetical protein [Bartonella sp. F02]
MNKIAFVKEDEVLVIICEQEESGAYNGPIEQAEEVLEIVEEHDTVQRLLRLDLKTLHADDVSEQLADVYMQNHEIHAYNNEFQPFILESDAYHIYLDKKNARDYEDRRYGSYEQQHRLRSWDVLADYWG